MPANNDLPTPAERPSRRQILTAGGPSALALAGVLPGPRLGTAAAWASAATSGSAPQGLRVIDAGGRLPLKIQASHRNNPAYTGYGWSLPRLIGSDCTSFRLVFHNFCVNDGHHEVNGVNDRQIKAVAVKKGSVSVPVTFAGARSAVVPVGGELISDPVTATRFGVPGFTRGMVLNERGYEVTSGKAGAQNLSVRFSTFATFPGFAHNVIPASLCDGASNEAILLAMVDSAAAYTDVSKDSSRLTGAVPCSSFWIGRPTNPTHHALVFCADSIGEGYGDNNGNPNGLAQAYITGCGFIDRAMGIDQATCPAYFHNSRGGSTSSAALTWTRRNAELKYADVLINEEGTNDFSMVKFADGGVAVAKAIRNNREVMRQICRKTGNPYIFLDIAPWPRILHPSIGGAATFHSAKDQTYATSAFAPGGGAEALTALLEQDAKTGLTRGVFKPGLYAGAPEDPLKWMYSSSVGNFGSGDGIHPTPAAHAAVAAPLRRFIDAALAAF